MKRTVRNEMSHGDPACGIAAFLAAWLVLCGGAAIAGGVATNFWAGGNSEGGGWATAGNWSAGVPVAGQVLAFRNGDVVKMSNADVATATSADGFDLRGEGTTLYLPQDASASNTYPPVYLGDGTTLYIQGANNTTLKALNGSGHVTSAVATANRNLYLGERGKTLVSDFAGRFSGRINIYVAGAVRLTGTVSTSTGNFIVYRNVNDKVAYPAYGTVEIAKFGTSDGGSSIGKASEVALRYAGRAIYTGDGETTDKGIIFRHQENGVHNYPETLDAGAHGGVTFNGTFHTYHQEADRASTIVLTGSNTVPCVIAGEWKESIENGTGHLVAHVTKRGSGTWRFADHASRRNSNGFAVEEGTLQFDSIAEANAVCSLGLATMLQKPNLGTYSAANDVDYAYLLGGETTNVVFEYTGAGYSTVTTRPIALTGQGARLKSNSSGSKGGLSFSGVSAVAGGEAVKTLWLCGTNKFSRVGEVSDGAGKVGITKEDSGTWTLIGNQTFSGPLEVKAGTLVVARKRPYTWFRFTVKGICDNDVFFLNEFGLFNQAGVQQNKNLAAISSGTGKIKNSINYMTLTPGQATIATSKVLYWWPEDYRNLNGLFDGEGSGKYWRSMVYDGGRPTWNSTTHHIPVVFRLPAGADEVSSCDVVSASATQSVTAFSLDGSCDGVVWTNLVNKQSGDFDYTQLNKWLSDMSAYPGETHVPAVGWRFTGHEGSDGFSSLENASAVSVAPGATLKAEGSAVTLHCLTLDAANGNGTIDGFDFAENGVVNFVNAPSGAQALDVQIRLANLPDGALARLNGWSVALNGQRKSMKVAFDGTRATAYRLGTMVIIR